MDNICEKPELDLVVVFDNTDTTPGLRDPKVNANRYLLLDVLGKQIFIDFIFLFLVALELIWNTYLIKIKQLEVPSYNK
jgi:hypothetical protein